MAGLASINIKFSADLKQFSSKIQSANRSIKKMGKNFTKTGKKLSLGITAPIIALGGLSAKVFSSFEQEMANVKAVSGATGSSFKKLEQDALRLGSATQFSAKEVAQLQLNFSKLGFSSDEILKVTKATLNLSIATGEDLASSAAVAASTIRGFGLSADETNRVVDVMAKSFSSSALDLEKFKVAMSVLGPVASNANVSLEQATGYLSVLVNAGIDASTAGTGLRNIFLDIAQSGIPLNEALSSISESSNSNAVAMDLFGKRGATVANVLAQNIDSANSLSKEYDNSSGSAKKMADIVGNTLQGAMLRMESSFEGLAISFGKVLAPSILKISEFLGGVADRFSSLSPETKKIIVVVGTFAAALGPLLVALGFMMTTVVPGLITSFGYLRASLLFLQTGFLKLTAIIAANPFGALAVAITALVGAFLYFNRTTEDTVKKQTLLNEINEKAAKSIATEKAKLQELLFVARNENIVKSARLKAIKELNALSPKYLGDLTLEKINTDAATKAVALYNAELLKTAKVKAAQAKLEDLQSQQIDLQLAREKESVDIATKEFKIYNKRGRVIKDVAESESRRNKAQNESKLNYENQVSLLKTQEEQILKIIGANQTLNKVVKPPRPPKSTKRERVSSVSEGLTPVGLNLNLAEPLKLEAEKVDTVLTGMQERLVFFKANADIFTNAIGSSFSAMGSQLANVFQTGNTILDSFVGSIINSLAQLAAAFVQQLVMDKLFATSKKAVDFGKASSNGIVIATNAAAALGPAGIFALPGLIASTIATVGASFAGIAAFENGGIVGGNSFSGDKLFARINSGEMVLNRRQQGNLASMLTPASQSANITLMPSLDVRGNKIRVLLNRVDSDNYRKN